MMLPRQGVVEAVGEHSIRVPKGHSAAALCAAVVNGHIAAVELLLEHAALLDFDVSHPSIS
jgi:hypothetical protein